MAAGSGKSTTGRSDAEVRDALSLVAKAEKAGIKTVQLQFVDIHGTVKSVQIPIHQMPASIKHGSWFDGSNNVRSSYRYYLSPGYSNFYVFGFRVARTP